MPNRGATWHERPHASTGFASFEGRFCGQALLKDLNNAGVELPYGATLRGKGRNLCTDRNGGF